MYIKKQLSKLGATEFILNEIKINASTIPFIKINEINELRRQLIDEFSKIRIKNYKIKKQQPINYSKFVKKELDYTFNITNEKAKTFYENCDSIVKEYGLEHKSQKNMKEKQLMETKHCIRYSLGLCSKDGKKLEEPLFLIDEKGQKYKLFFDCKNCKMKVNLI